MLNLEKIPDQIGYLVLTEDGAVVSSAGDLENDERVANIVTSLVSLTDKADPAFPSEEGFQRITVSYDEHSYIICLSNKRIQVVKRKISSNIPDPVVFA